MNSKWLSIKVLLIRFLSGFMRVLVLGSSSPGRREVLERLGVKFIVVEPKGVTESYSGSPRESVLSNARAKADYILKNYDLPDNAVLLTFDTVIVLKGRIIGKAESPEDALRFLKKLKCRWHTVLTGVVIHDKLTGKRREFVVKTRVKMRCYSDLEIDDFIRTGEPLGKAGAYAIQSLGALLVDKVEGDPYNVIGIPISRIHQELLNMNINMFKLVQDDISRSSQGIRK